MTPVVPLERNRVNSWLYGRRMYRLEPDRTIVAPPPEILLHGNALQQIRHRVQNIHHARVHGGSVEI